MQFAELKIGDRLIRADWPNLIATVTHKEPEMVELHIGNRGSARYYPAEFEQQPFEREPVKVKLGAKFFGSQLPPSGVLVTPRASAPSGRA